MAYSNTSGWVDPVTNFASLSGIDLRRDFRDLLQGHFPISFLPAFLHELTHHWCFQSHVGTALAMVRFAAVRHAVTRVDDYDSRFDLLDWIIRFESATGILRPLSEGLSQFAEFDLRPGAEELISVPLQWVLAFSKRPIESATFNTALLETLMKARIRVEVMERKTNLLVHPLDTSDGGYLAGYLFVKKLRRHLLARSNRFRDADFFLCYLRSYFYEDLGFVDTLFDSSAHDTTAHARLFDHFQQRLHRLLDEENLEPHLQVFENHVLRNRTLSVGAEGSGARQGILLTESEIDRGSRALARMTEELWRKTNDPSIDATLDHYDTIFLRRRHILCMAREKVSVRRNGPTGHVVCEKDGSVLALVPTLEGVGDFSGEGTLAFLVDGGDNSWAVSVTHNRKVIGLHTKLNCTPGELQWLASYATDDATYESAIDDIDRAFQFLLQDTSQGMILELFLQGRDRDVKNLYQDVILANVPADKRDLCAQTLQAQGFWGLLSQDLDLVNTYSALGLCSSLHLEARKPVEQLLRTRDLTLQPLLDALEAAESTYGLRLHYVGDSSVWAVY